MFSKLKGTIGIFLIAPLLLVYGYCTLFSSFAGYDDEGYILQSARVYLEHGGLYSTVYTQYGPAFYVLVDSLHRLTGAIVDHSFARWLTLAMWFGCAGGMAGMVARATASWLLSLYAAVATFVWLYLQGHEPFHPGSIILLLVAMLLLLVSWLVPRGRSLVAAGIAGAVVAVLLLLKINVGLMTAVGLVLWLALSARGLPAAWRWAAVGLTGFFAVGLMHTLVRELWVQIYLVVFATGLATLARAIRPETDFSWKVIPAFVAGSVCAAIAVLVPVMVRGTTLAGLADGILFGPLRHAANYAFAPDWRMGTIPLAAASLLASVWHRRLGAMGRWESADRWLATLRLIHYLALIVAVVALIEYRVLGAVFSFAVPWLWIWVERIGRRADSRATKTARDFAACTLLLQFLQAYPIGGIQIAWGIFPLFALAALAVNETTDWLRAATPGLHPLGRALGPVLATLAAGKLAIVALGSAHDYSRFHELGLPGTAGMRLKPRYAAVCATLSFNATLHADRLFSLPGMLSFNLWSQVPPPTLRNTTVWYTLLEASDQNDILQVLEKSPRACLVVERNVIALLQSSGFPPRGALVEYLLREFRPVFSLGGVDFWTRRGRTIAPAGTLWDYRGEGGTVTFRACLAGADETIAGLALADDEGRPVMPLISAATAAKITVRPVQPDGSPRGTPYVATWPLRFRGLAWIEVELPASSAPAVDPTLLLLQGEAGEHLGAAARVDTPKGP